MSQDDSSLSRLSRQSSLGKQSPTLKVGSRPSENQLISTSENWLVPILEDPLKWSTSAVFIFLTDQRLENFSAFINSYDYIVLTCIFYNDSLYSVFFMTFIKIPLFISNL